MQKSFEFKALNKPAFDSRITSLNVTNAERWLGFFVGPSIVACMFAISGQTYLNVFYTDVLKLSPVAGGMFLSMMPLVSKILDAITNIVMGRLIDRTNSARGKARPWVLLSGFLLAASGVLLFAVPTGNSVLPLIWVTASYNLFFCVSYTMYNISGTLLVPLATRNNKQRDTLALASSMGINIVPGMLISVLFPMLLLPYIGVDQNRWIIVMSVIAFLTIPSTLIQYYFTRERVTEEAQVSREEIKSRSLGEQVKGCFASKYWLIIMAIITLNLLVNNFYITSLIYYANWVLGTYNDGTTFTLLNVVGQAPLGVGIFALWPLVKKFGKRNIMLYGLIFGIAGSIIGFSQPENLTVVLGGLMIRALGTLSLTYLLLAMLADALDHVEWINGFRCDGFSSSVYSIVWTVTSGVAIGVFNLLLGLTRYVAPEANGIIPAQNSAVRGLFISGVFIVPAAGMIILAALLVFYRVEKELPKIRADVAGRHKAEAEARGEVYVSPEEKARLEQEAFDRLTEDKRIEELRAKCAKKGLDFESEEAKYRRKLARKNKKHGGQNETTGV
jgi:GPH family glycoside/pentoside/hexuronide:cation symporter